ncbi:MAG: hypothetical protein C4330_05970 [Chitinophagaceae bacterium]
MISLIPTNGGYVLLADTYRAQNNLQKAKEAYIKAVNTDGNHPVAYYKRGHAFTFLGDYEKARADYQKDGSLDDDKALSISSAAFTYLYEGKHKQGLQYLVYQAFNIYLSDATKSAAAMYDLMNIAEFTAFHINDAQSLQTIVQMMEPLTEERLKWMTDKDA